MRRRTALRTIGWGTAGLLVCRPTFSLVDLGDLSRKLMAAPRNGAYDVAIDAIENGADHRALLGAVFLAGIHDIQPRPVGGRLHSVMMVESAFQLAGTASVEDRWLSALWNMDYFKETQAEERSRTTDWTLPARPTVRFESEATARRAFVDAMDAWDSGAADRAVVGLLPFHDRKSIFEILWPYCARCIEYLGHKIVYGAQVERVLRRIPWAHAEPTIRSLTYGLLGRHGTPQTREYRRSVELAPSLSKTWRTGDNDPSISERLLVTQRTDTPAEAQARVVEWLNDGAAIEPVWDGVRLFATELFARRKSDVARSGAAIRAVHPVTELHAFGHAWRTTTDEATRRMLTVQAAGWIVAMRDGLIQRDAISMTGPAPYAVASDAPELTDPTERLTSLRRSVLLQASESHQYKYAGALEEECAQIAPRFRRHLLEPAGSYLDPKDDSGSERLERSRAALKKAGVA